MKDKLNPDNMENEIEYYKTIGIKLKPTDIKKLNDKKTIRFLCHKPMQEISLQEKLDRAYNDGRLNVDYMLDELDRMAKKVYKFKNNAYLREMYTDEITALNNAFSGMLRKQAESYEESYRAKRISQNTQPSASEEQSKDNEIFSDKTQDTKR